MSGYSSLRIGSLNRRIELQAPQRVSDGLGGFSTTYVTKFTVWAKIESLRGEESLLAMQLQSHITTRITIRYMQTIDSSWRIKYGKRIFNISGDPINPGEDKKTLEIMCME
jgi:SPP1 family predicted phage head-tail adaptor